jgi:hypothetical protein
MIGLISPSAQSPARVIATQLIYLKPRRARPRILRASRELRRLLGLKPWEINPNADLDAPRPYRDGTMGARSWPQAVALRKEQVVAYTGDPEQRRGQI